jgi:NAD-dependent deacetylase
VHGSIATSSCMECGQTHPLEEVQVRQAAEADGVPRCGCGHPLKPDVVLFGEMLPVDAIERAWELAGSADVLLCIGSSLEVFPVAELPLLTVRAGGHVAIVTQGPTPYDGAAQVKLAGDVVDELEALLAAL